MHTPSSSRLSKVPPYLGSKWFPVAHLRNRPALNPLISQKINRFGFPGRVMATVSYANNSNALYIYIYMFWSINELDKPDWLRSLCCCCCCSCLIAVRGSINGLFRIEFGGIRREVECFRRQGIDLEIKKIKFGKFEDLSRGV